MRTNTTNLASSVTRPRCFALSCDHVLCFFLVKGHELNLKALQLILHQDRLNVPLQESAVDEEVAWR